MQKSTSPNRVRHLIVGLVALGSLVAGCGSNDSSDDGTPDPSTTVAESVVTSGDPAVDEVESDLASLDADLQVIDEALAELDSLDTIAP
jgi:major membrane immunogen (membrane-anchored lipoprotein)